MKDAIILKKSPQNVWYNDKLRICVDWKQNSPATSGWPEPLWHAFIVVAGLQPGGGLGMRGQRPGIPQQHPGAGGRQGGLRVRDG
eukprot:scaffold589214_cov48-Prasinocladus_malaysianus.AAC.1